jgi:hypothetical protein
MRTRLIWFLVWFFTTLAQAQETDTLVLPALDTNQILMPKKQFLNGFFTKNYPNPKKALLFSIVPGGGQMYNRKWWKLPIVYGALGTVMYFEISNVRQYRNLRDNYRAQVDGDPDTNPVKFPTNLKQEDMKAYRDIYKRYVEINSLILGLTYLLTMTDAFVDAHLASFDVTEDLSLRAIPNIQSTAAGMPAFGLGLKFRWDK